MDTEATYCLPESVGRNRIVCRCGEVQPGDIVMMAKNVSSRKLLKHLYYSIGHFLTGPDFCI